MRSGTAPGPSIVLNVTGVVRPADPAAEFWTFDPTITGPTVNQNFWVAGALISASELSVLPVAYPLQNMQVSWGLPVRTSGLTVAELPAAINALTSVSAGDVGGLALKRGQGAAAGTADGQPGRAEPAPDVPGRAEPRSTPSTRCSPTACSPWR